MQHQAAASNTKTKMTDVKRCLPRKGMCACYTGVMVVIKCHLMPGCHVSLQKMLPREQMAMVHTKACTAQQQRSLAPWHYTAQHRTCPAKASTMQHSNCSMSAVRLCKPKNTPVDVAVASAALALLASQAQTHHHHCNEAQCTAPSQTCLMAGLAGCTKSVSVPASALWLADYRKHVPSVEQAYMAHG